MNESLLYQEKVKLALSYGDAEITLNDSTKKVSGFDLATHYGTITASGLNGNQNARRR